MSYPPRTDQRPGPDSRGVPGSRSGSQEMSLSLDESGLALDTTVQTVNSTLGTPQQDATGQALNSQVINFGAQPFVPGMRSAYTILKGPGTGLYTIHTFVANARIWGAAVSIGIGCSSGTGTQQAYVLVKTGGGVVLAIAEACIAGTTANDSNGDAQSLPGLPVLKGDSLLLDVNNATGISGGVLRASCRVLFSVP